MTRWGYNLERLRRERKLSKVSFAQLIGMSPQQLGDLIHSTDNPKVSTLQRIAGAVGVDIAELFRSPGETALTHESTIGEPNLQRGPVPNQADINTVRLALADALLKVATGLAEEAHRAQANARRQATGTSGDQSNHPGPDREDGG